MLSPQVWRTIRWQTAINTDYDGAVLVGGLENELRHFGDPDEEHDFWTDPTPSSSCPVSMTVSRYLIVAVPVRGRKLTKISMNSIHMRAQELLRQPRKRKSNKI